MREINFRAWHKKDGMVYYGQCDYRMLMNGDWYAASDTEPISRLNDCGYVFMQYTGLKDKNKKEIYEGDVIETTFDHNAIVRAGTPIIESSHHHGYTSRSQIAGFYLESVENAVHIRKFKQKMDEIERIIGNIYENPELIKEK